MTEIAVPSGTPAARPFEYDAAGNMTSARQEGVLLRRYVHDAWNRLVRVELRDQDAGVGVCVQPYPIAEYEYNPLHWRVVKRSDQRSGQACPEAGSPRQYLTERRELYYDGSWRLLHEEIDDATEGDSG